jgi:hypothetical protein
VLFSFLISIVQVHSQYQYFGLTIPGTSLCGTNALCYKKAAVTLFTVAVFIPLIALSLFLLVACCVRKRMQRINNESQMKIQGIIGMVDGINGLNGS